MYPSRVQRFGPDSSKICFGKTATINANISWSAQIAPTPSNSPIQPWNGVVNGLPFTINAIASPSNSTNYVLAG